MKSLRPLALKCSWSCNVWGGEGGWRQTTLHLQPTAMEEFTPCPVADQEEARPPLFLDQTEARDRPPCLRVWMIAPLPPPLIWRSAPQSPTNSPSRLSTLPHLHFLCTFYLSVNVFSTKVIIGDTIFTSPTGDGTAILRGHPNHAKVYPFAGQREYLHFSVSLRPWVLVRPRESNPRPPALQSSALPTELILPRSTTNSPARRSSLPHSQPEVLENFPPYPREAWIEGNIFFLPCLLSDQGTKLTKTQLAQQLGALVLTWKISTPTSLNMSSNKATPQTTSTCMLPDSH